VFRNSIEIIDFVNDVKTKGKLPDRTPVKLPKLRTRKQKQSDAQRLQDAINENRTSGNDIR
jgi:hypothetical protein